MINEKLAMEANERFYRAFNARDLDAMKKVWSANGKVICVHPGWPPLNGFEPTIESWEGIFKNSGNMDIQASDVHVTISEGLAWVSCFEKLYTIATNGVLASKVYATNIFQLNGGVWEMVMHHASSFPSTSEAEDG
mgnify:CR=1 FL=1